jgi:hypothetical protein
MTTQFRSGRYSPFSFFLFFLAIVLGAVSLGVFVHQARNGKIGKLALLIAGRTEAYQLSVAGVTERLQTLDRLPTANFSVDTVVESTVQGPVLPDVVPGDKILVIFHGEAIGGVDLSKLKPEDIQIGSGASGVRSIHVTLPASEVFSTTLVAGRTQVFAQSTGLTVPADEATVAELHDKALQKMQGTALSDGILDAARRNARASITILLGSLGFQQVEVD